MNGRLKNWLACASVAVWSAGCGGPASGPTSPAAAAANAAPAEADAHAHPTHGPHAGELIELGNEEYHAELLHDDKSVTIYILDSAAKTAVPIDATEVRINLQHDGQPEQFTLAATPDAGDPAGKSSKFSSQDAELAADIEHAEAKARLVVTINGQQYNGEIVHDHGGEGHGHAH